MVKKEGEAVHYCCDSGGCFLLRQLLCYSTDITLQYLWSNSGFSTL